MKRPPDDHIRRFMSATRAERRGLASIAKAAGLSFCDACDVLAYGVRAGKLRIRDEVMNDKWIEEVRND